jgi:hypothetical protein
MAECVLGVGIGVGNETAILNVTVSRKAQPQEQRKLDRLPYFAGNLHSN